MTEEMPNQIGRYQIQAELGRGGFGRVYRALDPTVGRLVAVKVLTEGGKDVLTRFHNEAIVAGNLRHENIVTIYEYGEYEGRPFLAMEYLEGENLHQIITSHKPLTVLQKCNIMSQVAEGLYYAHQSGVVHRDVKPANIMVLGDGAVKIMDFGIARLTRDSDATRLTQEGCVIGTLLYIAPEQFARTEIDELCDIFAYGVVYYELITGRHPFEAPDSRSLIYKISFEEPPPVRNFAPDCPEALQQVISRTLHKDREMRYQTLKAVQFDIEPIRIELRQDRAAKLLVQAQELFEKKQLDPAQTVVLEVLSLDPANRAARSLWENLQKQLQQRTLQPRIDSLLKAAEEHLAQRRFMDAVQNFEAALRLDRDSVYIQSRLGQARELLKHSKEAALLLENAKKELARQEYTAAYKSVSEALHHDPQSPEVTDLLKMIQGVIERRQQEQRVEEAISKAEGLLLLRAYDEAIAVLAGLGADAESEKIKRLVKWIRNDKAEHERMQRLHNEMAASTDLLREHRFADAIQMLESLKAEFPENEEVAHLHSYAQKELTAQARARAVEKVVGEIRALTETHNYDGALAALDQALKKYPGEGVLIRLLGSTMAAKVDWERQQAIQTAVGQCQQLQLQKRFAEAIQIAEAALREYSGEPALLDLLQQLEKDWEQQRRAEAIRKAAEQAQKFLDQNQPEKAVQLMQQSCVQYPGEPPLSEMLVRAQEEVRVLERARATEAIGQEATKHLDDHDFDGALQVLERGLKAWPGESALLRQQEATLAAKQQWERQQAIGEMVRRGQQLGVEKRFGEALQLMAVSLRQFPSEPLLVEVQKQLEQDWEQHKLRETVLRATSEARLLMSRGRLDEALETLQEALREHPGQAELESLAARVQDERQARERAAAVEKLVDEVHQLTAEKQFERAIETLEQGLKIYAAEPRLLREMDAVRAAEVAWQREQAIEEIVLRVAQLASEKRFADALQLVARSALEYKDDPKLIQAQEQCEKAQEQQKRLEAIARSVAAATTMLDQGRPSEAVQMLHQALVQYPSESELERLYRRAQEELKARERAEAIAKVRREVRARVAQHDFAGAVGVLGRAFGSWPGEPQLLSLQKAVEHESAVWEREQAIQESVRQGDQLGQQGRFEEALQLVASSLETYPGEPALLDVLHRLERDWERRQRAEAVARISGEARSLIGEGRFEDAISSLGESIARYAGEAELESLLRHAQEELGARQRREQAGRDAEALIEAGRFEAAIESMLEALRSFPRDAALESLRSRAQEQLRLRQRAEDIEKLANDTQALVIEQNFDGALQLLDRGLKDWPGEKILLDLQQSARTGKAAWLWQEALLAKVRQAEKLGRENRFAEGLQAVEAALAELGDQPALLEFRKQFRLRKGLQDGKGMIDQGKPAEALQLLEGLASDYPAEPELLALRERAGHEVRASERAAAIAKLGVDARASAETHDFDSALALLDQGLRNWPDEPSLLHVREITLAAKEAWQRKQAIQDAVRQCELLEQDGRLADAWEITLRLPDEFSSDDALVRVQQRLRRKLLEEERRRARERTDAIDKLGKNARAQADAGDFEGALAILEQGLRTWPNEAALLEIRQATIARKEAWQRQQAIQAAVEQCERLEKEDHLDEALSLTERFVGEFGNESLLVQVRQRLQGKLQERERRQQRDRDIQELRQLNHEVSRASGPSQTTEMLERARTIVARYPGNEEVRAAGADPIRHLAAVERAERELANRNFDAVLEICGPYLAQYPDHVLCGALRAKAERGQKLAYLENLQRRASAEADLDRRARMLEEALQRYPAETWVNDELRFTRNKLSLVSSIVEKARAHEAGEQWNEALEEWKSLLAIYKNYPNLDAEIARIQQTLEQAHAADIAHHVSEIERHLAAGELAKTRELIQRAQTEFPEISSWQQLARQLDEIRRKKTQARELLSQGQAACAQGNYQEGWTKLQQAFELDKADPAFRKLVVNALVKYAQAAGETDWRQAEALLRGATSLEPKLIVPENLLHVIADRKKDEIVNDCLAQADQLAHAGDVPGALVEVERALCGYPEEPRLKRLRETLADQVRQLREGLIHELRDMNQPAQNATDPALLEAARDRASMIAVQHEADAELKALADETARNLTSRIKHLKKVQFWARLAAQRKWIGAFAAGIVVVIAVWLGVRAFLSRPAVVPLQITVSPPGATIKVGKEECTAATCDFKLTPGTYSMEARLDGYRPVVRSIKVGDTAPALFHLVLEPLRPVVQVSTNFSSGRVSIDGTKARDLQNGGFTWKDVPFGAHELLISGADGEARVSFQMEAGHLPVLRQPVQVKNAEAVVVSNLGRTAKVDCNCANDKVTLDGKPAGEMQPNGLDLHYLSEGNKELKVGERSPLVVSFETEPALNIFLTSSRDVGTLVVESNVDNFEAVIDGKTYSSAGQKLIRIPLDSAVYNVVVKRNGYKSLAGQKVQIDKGGTRRLLVKLEPQNAHLLIRDAMTETLVSVDSRPVGKVERNGRFSFDEITPTDHKIELAKPGYVSKTIQRRFEPGKTMELGQADGVALERDQNAAVEDRLKREQAAWDSTKKDDSADLQRFLNQYPKGKFAPEANTALTRLSQLEQQHKAAQAEQAAWDSTKKDDPADLQRFLNQYPKGKFTPEANSAIAHLEQQRAQHQADVQNILALLRDYEAAYNIRDFKAVQNIFPRAPVDTIKKSLRDTPSTRLKLTPKEGPDITGERARVQCQYLLQADRAPSQSRTAIIVLQKSAGRWLIEAIQYPNP